MRSDCLGIVIIPVWNIQICNSRSKLVRNFCGTSIPAMSMISHEISWWDISFVQLCDTSNTVNSSDASKTSASVTRLSSYFGQLPIACYLLCLNCFTLPRIIITPWPPPECFVRHITIRDCPLKIFLKMPCCISISKWFLSSKYEFLYPCLS